MAGNPNIAEYGKETQFVSNDPRSGRKPVGAKMRQITRFRRLLEKVAKLPEVEGLELLSTQGEQFTEMEVVCLVQLAKARLGDKDAAKFVMDYAGFKPSEHIELENKDIDEFASETEEQQSLEQWINDKNREAVIRSDEVLDEAKDIANGKHTD